MRACVYARAYDCGQIVIRTQDQHTTSTPTEHTTTGKGRNTGNKGKPEYICMIAANEKSIKKVKKNLQLRKKVVSLHRNQTTNKFNYKITKQ